MSAAACNQGPRLFGFVHRATVRGISDPILAGVRVLDLTQYLSGPTVTRLMAEMGADIVKVEQAPYGDPIRGLRRSLSEALEKFPVVANDLAQPRRSIAS